MRGSTSIFAGSRATVWGIPGRFSVDICVNSESVRPFLGLSPAIFLIGSPTENL